MSDEVQKGVTIGDANDPVRMAERRKRLRQAIERAEGERKVSLQAEIDRISARLDEIRVAIAD